MDEIKDELAFVEYALMIDLLSIWKRNDSIANVAYMGHIYDLYEVRIFHSRVHLRPVKNLQY